MAPRKRLGCRQKTVLRMGSTNCREVAEKLELPLHVAESLLKRLIELGLMSGHYITGVKITDAGNERMKL